MSYSACFSNNTTLSYSHIRSLSCPVTPCLCLRSPLALIKRSKAPVCVALGFLQCDAERIDQAPGVHVFILI